VDDFNEEYVTAAERDFRHQAWQLKDHFKKLLEVTCPNHTYPIKHKLKECTMMKNFMTTGALLSYPGSKKHRTEASICVLKMFNHTHSNNMINR
jgi:hypothetical protein